MNLMGIILSVVALLLMSSAVWYENVRKTKEFGRYFK
jgi:hypothetical protein